MGQPVGIKELQTEPLLTLDTHRERTDACSRVRLPDLARGDDEIELILESKDLRLPSPSGADLIELGSRGGEGGRSWAASNW
jgi:hypothetical protein